MRRLSWAMSWRARSSPAAATGSGRRSGRTTMSDSGIVYLVGAGPGDPELLTLKGQRILASADVVIHDRLANPRLLRHCRPDAEIVDAGKRGARRSVRQDEINELMIAHARSG